MTAGGKRKGAGRKPLSASDKPEAVTIKAHPLAVARFKAWCMAKGISHREAFEAWVKRLRHNTEISNAPMRRKTQ